MKKYSFFFTRSLSRDEKSTIMSMQSKKNVTERKKGRFFGTNSYQKLLVGIKVLCPKIPKAPHTVTPNYGMMRDISASAIL